MEAVKVFENLPESEKAKFFELIKNNDSFIRIESESQGKVRPTPSKPTLGTLLENLIGAPKTVSEEYAENVRSPESKKKQKTLDGWLIKGSTSKNKDSDSGQKSIGELNVGRVSESCPVLLTAKKKNITSANSSQICSSEMCGNDPKLSNNISNYALIHSERLPSDVAEGPQSKRNKSNSPSPAENNYQIIQSPSKTSCNLGAKMKVTKKVEEVIGSSYLSRPVSEYNTVDYQITDTVSENKLPEPVASSYSYSKYEAFCKVRTACSQVGLDVLEILQHENIKKLLSDYENNMFKNAIILIKSHESNDQKVVPVVFVHKSETKDTSQVLKKMQEQNIL